MNRFIMIYVCDLSLELGSAENMTTEWLAISILQVSLHICFERADGRTTKRDDEGGWTSGRSNGRTDSL